MKFEEIKKRILRNYKVLAFTKIIGGLASVLTLLIIGRFLGVKEFGVFSIIVSSIEILNIVFSFRIWDTSVKFIGENIQNKDRVSRYLSFSIILSSLSSLLSFSLIIFLLYFLVDQFFNFEKDVIILLVIYSFSVLFTSTTETIDGILRTYNQYNSIFKINVSTNFFRLFLILICLYTIFSIKFLLLSFVLSSLVGMSLRCIYLQNILAKERINFKIHNLLNKNERKDYIKFMLNAHFSNILNLANDKNLGVVIVGYFVGPIYAGLYRAARAIVKIIRRIMDPALEIIFPEFVRLNAEKDFNNYKRLILESLRMILISSLVIGIIIYIFSYEILFVFFGEQFVAAETALIILILAMIIHNASYWVNPSMLALGKAKYLTFITAATTVIYCFSLFSLVDILKHDGAAISLVVRNLCTLLIGTYFYRRAIKEKTSQDL